MGAGVLEGLNEGVSVFGHDFGPHGRVAGGDASGVVEAGAGELGMVGILEGGVGGEAGHGVGKVADVGDSDVVLRSGELVGLAAEVLPEFFEFLELRGGEVLIVGKGAGGVFEEIGSSGVEAGLFGSGHGVASDEGKLVV